MAAGEVLTIALTGPDSHRFTKPAGQGSISIGPIEEGRRRPELVVEPDAVLNWSAFDTFTVPAGYPWPRVFRYRGTDTGFVDWSTRREIEAFAWSPTSPISVDAGDAGIDRFSIDECDVNVSIVLPRRLVEFTYAGDVSLLDAQWSAPTKAPGLYFAPTTRPSIDADPIRLPGLSSLHSTDHVLVRVSPLGQPFDCASLLQFPELTTVRLFGNLTNLDALGRFRGLRRIQLGDCPDLDGLPAPDVWPDLDDFHAASIEKDAGQRLRRHFKAHPIGRASITGLRVPGWFERHYGLPFNDWKPATARKATAAFRAAESAADPEAGIREFVRLINTLPDIHTIEREDAGDAVVLLATHHAIEQDRALEWFNEERDF